MAAEHLRAKIGYEFVDGELLTCALTAAHRHYDDPSFDGNRGLASLGVGVMEMVHTLYTVVVDSGTQKDVNKGERWYRSKKGQARACVNLGIDNFVNCSIRQQNARDSPTVLSNALAAIIGAIWLDLGGVNESSSNACERIFLIMCQIDDEVKGTTPMTNGESSAAAEGDSGIMSSSATRNRGSDPLNAQITRTPSESQRESLSSSFPFLFPPHNMESELDAPGPVESNSMPCPPNDGNTTNILEAYAHNTNTLNIGQCTNAEIPGGLGLPVLHGVVAQPEQRLQVDGGITGSHHMPMDTSETQATTAETGNKKNPRARRGRPPNSSLHQRLIEEELKKLNGFSGSSRGDLQALLDHPQILELSTNSSCVGQLRLLYLGIGSCQSLIQFKESLRVARTRSNTSVHAIGPNLLPKERFRAICLYDDQEALSVLVRRYHIAKLFETELENLRQGNAMIVETPSDFGTNHTPQAGNPAMIQEAALTDRLLEKIAPDLMAGTTEFKRVRDRLSQMRRLAKKLQVLIKTYGFGILALLPCGPSYSDFTITDCTLISIPEAVFAQFSELLYQHQGMVLAELSKAVEPALTALADERLESETLFPIEFAGVRDLEVLPMGSQEVLSICVCGALASL